MVPDGLGRLHKKRAWLLDEECRSDKVQMRVMVMLLDGDVLWLQGEITRTNDATAPPLPRITHHGAVMSTVACRLPSLAKPPSVLIFLVNDIDAHTPTPPET